MKKLWISVFVVCCLLFSACGNFVQPVEDKFTSQPEPPFEFTPKPASTVTEDSIPEPPFEFTPKPKSSPEPTSVPTLVPTPVSTLTPVPTPTPAPAIEKIICTECNGTGICARCGGDGVGFYDMPCNFCQGGKCPWCVEGYVTVIPERTPGPGDCHICGGDGECATCDGLGGYHSAYGDYEWIECNSCHGSKECKYCNGTGKE